MPGSTASPSDPSKAKVTSATNGVFVRPVAVAGIFCPTNDSNNTPPALPEKRRFSALVGDLRPVSSNEKTQSDDFARRRQSWDNRQKEVPFGQALLRKTPRNTDAPPPPRNLKSDSVKNGSTETEISSPSDKNQSQSSFGKSTDSAKAPELFSKSFNLEPNQSSSSSNSLTAKDSVNELKREGAIDQNKKELKYDKDKINSEKNFPKTFLSNESKTVKSDEDKKVISNVAPEKCISSTETVKQPKKVYGLRKRESKPEVTTISNDNCANNADVSTEVKNVTNKPKVYGLSKQNIKKEVEVEKAENELSQEKTALKCSYAHTSVSGKDSEKTSETKVTLESSKSKTTLESSKSKATAESLKSKSTAEPLKSKSTAEPLKSTAASESSKYVATSEPSKLVATSEPSKSVVPSESSKSVTVLELGNENRVSKSPPKDFRTVRRTSDVIAAKIQNIFSNFQPEKSAPVLPKKTKIPDKANVFVSSTIETKDKKENKGTIAIDDGKIEANNFKAEEKNVSDLRNEASKSNDSKIAINLNSSLKEPKPTSVSAAEKSNLDSEIARLQGVKEQPLLKKGDSKTEPLINTTSRQLDKKVPNTEGKMPIKKDDKSGSDGTMSFIIATNQETDRKSSNLTASSNPVMQGVNKDTGVKKFFNNLSKQFSGVAEDKNSKIIVNSQNVTTSLIKDVVPSNNAKAIKKLDTSGITLEGNVSNKESVLSKTPLSQSIASHSVQLTSSVTQKFSTSNDSSCTKVQKSNETTKTFTNNKGETTEISKIEVTKITPSTIPGIVPTVNVVFRTKSPLEPSNKDENRKKVVIETCTNKAPITSSVIISPKPMNKPSISSVEQHVNNALKTVESVQQSVSSSPKAPKKHTIVNLQNQELMSVSLSSNSNEKTQTEVPITREQSHIPTDEAPNEANKTKSVEISQPVNQVKTVNVPKIDNKQTLSNSAADASKSDLSSQEETLNKDRNVDTQSKVPVVDLCDWNKKFQRLESEIPRAPLRRRAQRDSLPPMLPSRSPSRFGSLKRIDDSPRYIPRSPSQSSLPQRYSYTEMLSKVCSMGVLPFVEPTMSKSCSSSSSQVSELWSELSEEQSTATHASEILEAETAERVRLEKEVHELQNRFSHVQQRSDKMEMEIMESRVYRTSELNGDLSEDEDADASGFIYKQKYERAVRDMEIMKRRFQQQQEEETEQKAIMKKASDKRLAEALEDVDEERQIANQWKRKAQKAGAELQDLRLMLEEQMARNGELEKKQRRFDAELNAAQEEIKKERLLREKITREKDQAVNEKYSLEQDLQSTKLDADMLHEKIAQLTRELDELTLSSKGEEEVTQLKRAKQDLERKCRDQEEELEELAAQVQMLEQAKLRLEMSLEKLRQEHRREASVREEEIEEIRASFSKKIKNLEAQLESEQDERHQLVKQKHELERRLYEIADQPPPHDPEVERRLRRDLKRTKALLRDAQAMLEHTREGQSSKTLIRQLKNQLEDSEFAKATAIKARQAIETELQDCQLQLEEITRTKNEAETKCLQLSREKSAIQTQLEEAEEEMSEVMKKYKAVVAQMSVDQKALAEQNQQIAELESERQMLKEQLNEVSHKFEHLAGHSDDAHKVHWLDSKIRDLESKLELEQTTKSRLENQIARLKEQNDKLREECDSLRNKEIQAQEGVRRMQRQIRDLREDYSALQQKEADGYRKQHELEMALENMETDLQVTKNDLRLACQRIQDLQNALEDDLDSGTDVPDDSGSDSDSSFELSLLRNQSLTPIQRCESIASNLSYDTDGRHSRTASFTQELSAFSRMMLRKTSMDFLG